MSARSVNDRRPRLDARALANARLRDVAAYSAGRYFIRDNLPPFRSFKDEITLAVLRFYRAATRGQERFIFESKRFFYSGCYI